MKRSLYRVYLFAIIAIVVCSGYAHSYDTFEENDNWKVELVEKDIYDTYKQYFIFKCLNKINNQSFSFTLKNGMTMVKWIHLFKAKFIIFGEIGSSSHFVIIYDLNEREIIDEVYGYHFQVSNDGRYMIYKRFFPRFIDWKIISDVILIYDFSRSPIDNRIEKWRKNRKDIEQAAKDGVNKHVEKQLDSENAGIPIFPEYNAKNEILIPHYGVDKYWVSEPIVWTDTDVRFLVSDETNEKVMAVWADVSQGIEEMYIYVKNLDLKDKMRNKRVRMSKKDKISLLKQIKQGKYKYRFKTKYTKTKDN